jgi:NitT/TauT family transport system ATP-binding protein
MSESVVRVKNVGRTFVSGGKKDMKDFTALEKVSFEVGRGEFVSLLGPSGCGKSTLLKIISGLLPATSGSVEIAEQGSERIPPFGFVFQDSVLLPWRTALDNALFPFEIMGNREKSDEKHVRELFSLAKLVGFEESYPRQLSGGMKQRVSIVRALSYNPPILLMDEPFGALDAITRDNLNNVLLEIWESTRKTVIFVTHSISEAVYLSDRIIVMGTKPGRVLKDMKVTLPRPRNEDTKLSPEFYTYVRELREMLK